jgi:hypothetical protein
MCLRKLTIGRKLAFSTTMLAAILLLTAWFGIAAAGAFNDRFGSFATSAARRLQLTGALSQAGNGMVAAQDATALSIKDPAALADARRLFQENSRRLRQVLSEIRPLLETDSERDLASHMDSLLEAWISAYVEVDGFAGSGNAD